jgi:hypothetical protein
MYSRDAPPTSISNVPLSRWSIEPQPSLVVGAPPLPAAPAAPAAPDVAPVPDPPLPPNPPAAPLPPPPEPPLELVPPTAAVFPVPPVAVEPPVLEPPPLAFDLSAPSSSEHANRTKASEAPQNVRIAIADAVHLERPIRHPMRVAKCGSIRVESLQPRHLIEEGSVTSATSATRRESRPNRSQTTR